MATKKKASTLSKKNAAKLQEVQDAVKEVESTLPMLDDMWDKMTTSVSSTVEEAQVTAAELEGIVQKRNDAYFVRALANESYRRAEAMEEHPLAQLKAAHREALSALTNTVKVAGGIKIAKAPVGGLAFDKADALRQQMEIIKLGMADFIAKEYHFGGYSEVEKLIAAENKLFSSKKDGA